MLYLLGVLAFLGCVMLSIALHEIGHLLPAKRSGVKVTQYMVGFGPTVWSRRRGETEYGLKAVPLGGYIRMIGMFPPRRDKGEDEQNLRAASTGWMRAMVEDARSADLDRVAPEDVDRVFYRQRVRNKLMIMLGGPTMNLLIGVVLMTVFLVSYGVVHETTTLGRVDDCVVKVTEQTAGTPDCAGHPASPAKAGGLKVGDKIVSVDGAKVTGWQQIRDAIRSATGRRLTFEVLRNGRPVTLTVTPVANQVPDGTSGKVATVGFLGVSPTLDNFPVAPAQVPGQLASYLGRTVEALGNVPSRMGGVWQAAFGGAHRDPNGPVGIVGVTRLGGEVAGLRDIGIADKLAAFLQLVAGLNLALFAFNLVPLLPLDGGHVAGALYEGARRQVAKLRRRPDPGPADVAKMLPVAYAVASVLVVMSVLLIYADLVNPVRLTG